MFYVLNKSIISGDFIYYATRTHRGLICYTETLCAVNNNKITFMNEGVLKSSLLAPVKVYHGPFQRNKHCFQSWAKCYREIFER